MVRMRWFAVVAVACLAACGDGGNSGVSAPVEDTGADASDTARDSADVRDDEDAPDDASDEPDVPDVEDATDTPDTADAPEPDADPGALTLTLPQALGGAAWANPELYPSIPVRAVTTGSPDGVTVGVRGGDAIPATSEDDTHWVAMLPIERLGEGRIDLVATATRGEETAEVVIELHLGDQGVQITNFEEVGSALTPMIHASPKGPVLTWTDRRDEGAARAWLQTLDGAGQLTGDRVQLTPDEHQAIYARTALSDDVVCVLYQIVEGETPFIHQFRVVDPDGNEVLAPVGLTPENRFGSYGGAVAWDGSGCVMTYRVNNGSAEGELYWRRWDADAGLGPAVQLAASGNNDPHGGFNAISFLDIAATPEHSVVTFVRQYFNPSLQTRVDRAQLRIMRPDGTFVHRGFVGRERSFFWHNEIHVDRIGNALVPVWAEQDLTDEDPNPTTTLQANFLDPASPPEPADGLTGQVLVTASQNRGEPVLIEHDQHFAVLAWTDERTYDDVLSGGIELRFRPVDHLLGRLTPGDEAVIRHARFIAGTGHVRGQQHGGNIFLVWTDERHGNGILDPRPETYFETLWF